MESTPEGRTQDAFAQISSATGAQRQALIENFLTERRKLIERVTASVARTVLRQDNRQRLTPDVESVVWECAWQILTEDHDGLDQVVSFGAVLTSRARREATKHLESPAVTGVGGTSNLRTKQRAVGVSRRELRSVLGVEPDVDQLVEYHNEKMTRRRSNPTKQGALVEPSDLAVTPQAVLADSDDGVPEAAAPAGPALTPTEGHGLAREVVDRCTRHCPELGAVAHTWLGDYLQAGDFGDDPVADVAGRVGRSVAWTRGQMLQVREVAQQVALEWGLGRG